MLATRAGHRSKTRVKNNVPLLAILIEFWYIAIMMGMAGQRHEQQQRFLKAKVALALYREYGRVPREAEIDHVYHLTRLMYKAVVETRFIRKQHKTSMQ